jgi:protein involved in polysaccharide export with SLBB domain
MRLLKLDRPTFTSALLTGMLLLGACSTQSPDSPFSGAPKPQTANLGANPELSRIYRLGVGDKVKISVFGENELSGPFEIGAGGMLALPLIGEIPAKGQTVTDLRRAIESRLKAGYLKDPKVSVEVTAYRPFYVHGEVRSGGEVAFKNGVTVRDAIAIAGGYTYRANHSYVLLIREGSAQEIRVQLPSTDIVMPGDNIRVPERFF